MLCRKVKNDLKFKINTGYYLWFFKSHFILTKRSYSENAKIQTTISISGFSGIIISFYSTLKPY